MDIDLSLDALVEANKKSKRGGRRGNRGRVVSATRAKYATAIPSQQRQTQSAPAPLAGSLPGASSTAKIIVSNLPDDVTDAQIKELFHTTVGPLKFASISYNEKGKSTGVATIEFSRPGDASKAFQQYNNRLIDQKRPMKVEIVVDPTRRTLAERVGPPPVTKAATANAPNTMAKSATTTKSGGQRRGAGVQRRGRRRGNDRPNVTAADLDQDMEVWRASETEPSGNA